MLLAIGMSGFLVNPAGSNRLCGELVDENLERDAVLQADRDRRAEHVHQAADRRTLLGHRDEQLARPAVGIEADVDVALVTLDVELVSQAPPGVGQALAPRLDIAQQRRRPRRRHRTERLRRQGRRGDGG